MAELKVKLSPQVIELIDQLVDIGLYGLSREDVAERLLLEKLREVVPLKLSIQSLKTRRRDRP